MIRSRFYLAITLFDKSIGKWDFGKGKPLRRSSKRVEQLRGGPSAF